MLKLPLMIFSTVRKSLSRDILVKNDEPSPAIGVLVAPKESQGCTVFSEPDVPGGFSRIVLHIKIHII